MTAAIALPDIAAIPDAAGAYLLAVDLAAPLALDFGGFGGRVLPPGRYVYCGSAYGPGGLRARIGRHLKRGKPLRWHVDRLTAAGHVAGIAAIAHAHECDLVARVLAVPGATVPAPGFGSSDCRRCPAHLIAVPAECDVAVMAGAGRLP
jgi:Uri superfamily endonuclease